MVEYAYTPAHVLTEASLRVERAKEAEQAARQAHIDARRELNALVAHDALMALRELGVEPDKTILSYLHGSRYKPKPRRVVVEGVKHVFARPSFVLRRITNEGRKALTGPDTVDVDRFLSDIREGKRYKIAGEFSE